MDAYISLYRETTCALSDETFGYTEKPTKPGAFAVACDYATNATTIGDALGRLCRFYALVTDELTLSLRPASAGYASFDMALRGVPNWTSSISSRSSSFASLSASPPGWRGRQ